MKIGTCNFVNKRAAIQYYSSYITCKGNGKQRLAAVKALVDEKLRLKEIKLGPPSVNDGESLYINNEERFFIKDI